ncbi:MAG: signal peptidase I [Eubacteriales bacterium]|nr:signal peptidase I [Eubacteriales bacterium]
MKVLRKLWSVITTLLVAVMVILAVLLVGVRVVGLTPYAVLSGSMEPTYHVGALIYVKDVAPADITVGMPITFVVNEDLLLATHRVVDIEVLTTRQEQMLDEAGTPLLDDAGNPVMEEVPLDEPVYYYQTKGDANDAVDGTPVHYKNVVGTPVFSIPYLGYLSSWLQTRQGMIMGICIALVLVILTFLPDLLRAVDEPKKPKRGKHEPQ